MHDPGLHRAVDAQRGEHALGHGRVGDADQLTPHPARVGHRPEQVEHGRDADLAPAGRGEPERRVVRRCQAEADAGLLDAAQHALGRQLDRDAQRLEHVGRAALRRRRAGAVLAHGTPAPAVTMAAIVLTLIEWLRSPPVPTMSIGRGPQLVAQRHERGGGEHGVEQAGELLGCLALGPQRDDEADQLGRRGVARRGWSPSPPGPARP